MTKKLFLLIFLLGSFLMNAQETSEPQMADGLRAEGKIYVVIAVMTTVFICVVAYLTIIDRKVKKLEDEFRNKK